MKIVMRIIIVLIIAVPIFMCWKTLQTVWNEEEEGGTVTTSYSAASKVEDNKSSKESDANDNKVTASNLGDGVSYDITGINIISKVYENAEVAISLANIYEEHDENSKVVGKLEKGSQVTVQNYDNGWSTVTNYTYSGWMKTENIKLPTENTNMVINTSNEVKLGTVKVSDGLNVRSSADRTANNVIGSLSNGETVSILDDSVKGWYQIKYGNSTGWVASDYVVLK